MNNAGLASDALKKILRFDCVTKTDIEIIERALAEAEKRGRLEGIEKMLGEFKDRIQSAKAEGQREMRERVENYVEARTYLKREDRELMKKEIRALPIEGE